MPREVNLHFASRAEWLERKNRMMSIKAICPECDVEIAFSTQPTLGQCVICANCQSAMTIKQLNPIVLDWAFLAPLEPARIRPNPSVPNHPEQFK
jgi:hypothetical protein